MSKREEFVNSLITKISDLRRWTEPYGILTGKHTDAKGKVYQSITFGMSRQCSDPLPLRFRVYSPTFMLLVTNRGEQLFKSEQELLDYLKKI